MIKKLGTIDYEHPTWITVFATKIEAAATAVTTRRAGKARSRVCHRMYWRREFRRANNE